MAVANWSDKETQASIHLPGPLRSVSSCRDAETGETVVLDDPWTVTVPAHDLRVFRIGQSR